MSTSLLNRVLDQRNAPIILNQAVVEAVAAASMAAKEFAFESNLNGGLSRTVNSFITTGEESDMVLVILYLTKLREEKEKQQMLLEEKEIDLQREEKARLDAEEDRMLMFLQRNHSREALH